MPVPGEQHGWKTCLQVYHPVGFSMEFAMVRSGPQRFDCVLSIVVCCGVLPHELQQWFEEVADEALHLSVLTLCKLRRGIEKLPAGKRKEKLRYWLEHEVPAWFGARLLPVDTFVADTWGRLQAVAERTLPATVSSRRPTAPVRISASARSRLPRSRAMPERRPGGDRGVLDRQRTARP